MSPHAGETVGAAYLYQASPDADPVKVRVIARETRADGAAYAYIHYEGLDRRLDEWVPEARLTPRANGADASDGEDAGHHHKRRRLSTAASLSASLSSPRATQQQQQQQQQQQDDADDAEAPSERQKQIWHHGAGHDANLVRNVRAVQLGPYLIDAWYYSPYPAPYDKGVDTLYVCEHTFKYLKSPGSYRRHLAGLTAEQRRAPPGDEIYRDEARGVSVFRVEGKRERLFCQNLCLLGKLFIEHKTLHFDPAPFLFYLVTDRVRTHDGGLLHRPVGYFSKEVDSPDQYNLACILTLPPYQRRGFGRFIISLSYELSKREGKLGAPEKPLSDLGKLSYRAYWSCALLTALRDACAAGARPSVRDLAAQTGVKLEDVVSTLQALGLIKRLKGSYVLAVQPDHVQQLLRPFVERDFARDFCRPECLLLSSSG